jgi:hypothetical protein
MITCKTNEFMNNINVKKNVHITVYSTLTVIEQNDEGWGRRYEFIVPFGPFFLDERSVWVCVCGGGRSLSVQRMSTFLMYSNCILTY